MVVINQTVFRTICYRSKAGIEMLHYDSVRGELIDLFCIFKPWLKVNF